MTFQFTPSRRTLLAGAGALAVGGPALARAGGAAPVPSNPLVRQRADALIFKHTDGLYYMTASVPELSLIHI